SLAGLSLTLTAVTTAAETSEEKTAQALKKLRDRATNKSTDFAKLRKDILAFRLAHTGGSPAVGDAAALFSELPPRLDKLSATTIPALEKFDWQPKELVAVLGEHRGRHGHAVSSVAFSADNTLLASGGGQYVRVWNTTNMRLTGLGGASYGITSVAF